MRILAKGRKNKADLCTKNMGVQRLGHKAASATKAKRLTSKHVSVAPTLRRSRHPSQYCHITVVAESGLFYNLWLAIEYLTQRASEGTILHFTKNRLPCQRGCDGGEFKLGWPRYPGPERRGCVPVWGRLRCALASICRAILTAKRSGNQMMVRWMAYFEGVNMTIRT